MNISGRKFIAFIFVLSFFSGAIYSQSQPPFDAIIREVDRKFDNWRHSFEDNPHIRNLGNGEYDINAVDASGEHLLVKVTRSFQINSRFHRGNLWQRAEYFEEVVAFFLARGARLTSLNQDAENLFLEVLVGDPVGSLRPNQFNRWSRVGKIFETFVRMGLDSGSMDRLCRGVLRRVFNRYIFETELPGSTLKRVHFRDLLKNLRRINPNFLSEKTDEEIWALVLQDVLHHRTEQGTGQVGSISDLKRLRNIGFDMRKTLDLVKEKGDLFHALDIADFIWLRRNIGVDTQEILGSVNERGDSILHTLLSSPDKFDILYFDFLLVEGIDVNARDREGNTPLMKLLKNFPYEEEFQSDETASVNLRNVRNLQRSRDNSRWVLDNTRRRFFLQGIAAELHSHLQRGLTSNARYLLILKSLLEKGADVNVPDNRGVTPLIQTIVDQSWEAIRRDVSLRGGTRDIDIFPRVVGAWTPTTLLIDSGADLDTPVREMIPSMMLLPQQQSLDGELSPDEFKENLLSHILHSDKTPREILARMGYDNLQSQEKAVVTFLYEAIEKGDVQRAVSLISQRRIDLNDEKHHDMFNGSFLEMAVNRRQWAIASHLVEAGAVMDEEGMALLSEEAPFDENAQELLGKIQSTSSNNDNCNAMAISPFL